MKRLPIFDYSFAIELNKGSGLTSTLINFSVIPPNESVTRTPIWDVPDGKINLSKDILFKLV